MGLRRWLGTYALFLYAFLHVPLLILAVFSVNSSRFTVWEGLSLKWYRALLTDSLLLESAANSLVIALCSTAIATIAGTLLAYALWKRGSQWIMSLMYASLVVPEIVMGVALLVFFQWLFRFGHFQLGMHTVILAHVSFCLAYVVFVVVARLRDFDPALEEAAMDLGANEFEAFRRVTLPNLAPAIAAAALLAFTVSMDDYVITSLVAGVDSQTLPMAIYAIARRGANPVLSAVSTLMVAGLCVLVTLAEKLRAKA
jgi:spermidine/putrescine transport system permease protein